MSGLIAKFVFNKILRENPDNSHGADDPYFESLPAGRLSVGRGTKRRKKALPPGLSREDEKTLIKVKRRAYRLDMALGSFCGMRVGWSSLIAIIPGIGDVLDVMLALMVIRTASQANLPSAVRARMMLNLIIDFVIGLVPFLGDIVDIGFKANTRNAIILENFLRERGAENIRRQGLPQQPDPSLGDSYDRDEREAITQQPGAQPAPNYPRGGLFGLFGDSIPPGTTPPGTAPLDTTPPDMGGQGMVHLDVNPRGTRQEAMGRVDTGGGKPGQQLGHQGDKSKQQIDLALYGGYES
ncbi:hypothetical protein C7212DRAFT_341741 [Tuber magnatum]|uniref:PH domain-containing protein n=1 Tax=Tuber magnatum TaxID=42249 RepID=A0A317T137_9PEZI|nr:hypothetical protein C7212DRAFT_341741 [Tuber magnatum]